jgi:hypothetical protein
MFAAPGTVVYETFPGSYLPPCINRLAQMQELHYWCDMHQAESSPGLWDHHAPWSVDIAQMKRRLRDLPAIYCALFN